MPCEIINVGTELLLGEVVNTNAAYLAQKLAASGIELFYQTSVGDDRARLSRVLRGALKRSDIVIITGGLGPTQDDITKEVVAKILNRRLVPNKKIISHIEGRFRARGIPMPKSNYSQALVPQGATVLKNEEGTAPGLVISHEGKTVVLLPGVPGEMKSIVERQLTPLLERKKEKNYLIISRYLKVFGLSESAVDEKIKDLMENTSNPSIGILPRETEIVIRITARTGSPELAEEMLSEMEEKIRQRLGDFIFAADQIRMEEVVGMLLEVKKRSLAVAESCTGGLISHLLTNVPGISRRFLEGVIAYSNQAKVNILKVPQEIIHRYGAVSSQTAEAMAQGVKKLARSHLGLAITGIAGPGGGSIEKPVGLVYIALADGRGVNSRRERFLGEREEIKARAAQTALDMLRRYLIEN